MDQQEHQASHQGGLQAAQWQQPKPFAPGFYQEGDAGVPSACSFGGPEALGATVESGLDGIPENLNLSRILLDSQMLRQLSHGIPTEHVLSAQAPGKPDDSRLLRCWKGDDFPNDLSRSHAQNLWRAGPWVKLQTPHGQGVPLPCQPSADRSDQTRRPPTMVCRTRPRRRQP